LAWGVVALGAVGTLIDFGFVDAVAVVAWVVVLLVLNTVAGLAVVVVVGDGAMVGAVDGVVAVDCSWCC